MAGHAHPQLTGTAVKPTAKQLSYLRTLAIRTGQTFTPPKTRADASREIQRLRKVEPTSSDEQRRERRDIRDALASSAGASAAVCDHEISGFGASCEWASQ
jgi:hypothetical protein